MKTINLQKIVANYEHGAQAFAKELFPSNKFPSMALARVIQGKANLDADQISKLALITGQSFNSLFGVDAWRKETRKDKIIFTCDDFTAEIDTINWVSKVYHKKSIFHEEILHTGAIVLSSYLATITEVIKNHKIK
jgi:hypothetical protein